MMMHIGALTTDFHSSSIRMRDALYFEKDHIVSFINKINPDTPLREIVVLCTCNRIELYYVCEDHEVAADWLTEYLAQFHHVPINSLRKTMVNYRCEGAVRHIFRVASGVESMIFGEHEILGQIRDAYFFCREQQTTDSLLNRLFQQAIATGKLVRYKTGACKGSLSVSSIAVDLLIEKSGGSLNYVKVMVVGTGLMGLRALKRIALSRPAELGICNRTNERAEKLCNKFNGKHILYEDFKKNIYNYDCIIMATSSQEHILTADNLMSDRKKSEKPLLLIDLGAPRNVDPAIGALDGVNLVCVDDLQITADKHLQVRVGEIEGIEKIIEEQVKEFTRWYKYRSRCECSLV